MTASSLRSDSQAAYGRLKGNRGNGWCTKEAATNDDWLQIDLGKRFDVCGVATQGGISGNEWVTDFKMSYLSDGRIWTLYKDGNEDVVRTELFFSLALDLTGDYSERRLNVIMKSDTRATMENVNVHIVAIV